MGGGSVLTRNVLFNFCRESSDHGPFNSWNRQVYLVDGPDGKATTQKLNDTISFNVLWANYHSRCVTLSLCRWAALRGRSTRALHVHV